MSTPEQKCIGWPEQKYISEAGKKARRTGGPWFRHQAWIGLSAGQTRACDLNMRSPTPFGIEDTPEVLSIADEVIE